MAPAALALRSKISRTATGPASAFGLRISFGFRGFGFRISPWRRTLRKFGVELVMPDSNSSSAVFKSRAKELAALMATSEERARLWRPDELAAIFKHQISTPMLVDLGCFDPRTATRLRTLSEAQGLLLKSFSDLFHHPAPPVELLQLVKDFAKANLDHPESGLPGEIASALYYTSIASALVHLDARITKLQDADLRAGLNWTREQGWLDQATKELLGAALAKISAGQKGGQP
jgi:hypothetical protein